MNTSRTITDAALPPLSTGVCGSGMLQQNRPPSLRSLAIRDAVSGPGIRSVDGQAGTLVPSGSLEPNASFDDANSVSPIGAFFIGVTGASASGKTTVCTKIIDGLGSQRCALISLDWFYHGLPPNVRALEYNFDHPDAFDFAALRETLEEMRMRRPVSIPMYNFAAHARDKSNCVKFGAADVVIVEGILTCYDPEVREMMHMKIFVDEDPDICLARRVRRDVASRGRAVESILSQYENFVKPSFERYILPTKRYADIVIPRGGDNLVAIDLIVKHIALKIRQDDMRKLLPNLVVMNDSYQARGLHTVFRDAQASREDFVFYSDRLIRLLVEEGLGLLPMERKHITTPTGASYYGVGFSSSGIAGVSLLPGGAAMENALRAVCANIRVGKMLITSPSPDVRKVSYSKLPGGLSQRYVMLMDPVLNTGLGCVTAIEHLTGPEVGCLEERITVLTLIASRQAVREVCARFPKSRLVVSAVDSGVDRHGAVVPGVGDFSTRYFGTD
jgi:uridine kinase